MKLLAYFLFSITLFLISCKTGPVEESSPTTGSIHIFCDEALQLIVQQEEEIFERNYPKAQIHIHYLNENDLFKKFMYDTFETIITARALDSNALRYLDQNKSLHPRTFPFANSALAFVCSHNSADSLLKFENIKDAIEGIGYLSNKRFVIENKSSGIAKSLLELTNKNQLPSNFYAMNSLDTVLEFVSRNIDCIGIIDWSGVSDSDDPKAQSYLNKVNLIKITRPLDSTQKGYLAPLQYNLQDKIYPFTRTLNVISRTGKSDLGLGFASFITGEIGQKIILKAGLLPLYQTERLIELKSTGDVKVVQ